MVQNSKESYRSEEGLRSYAQLTNLINVHKRFLGEMYAFAWVFILSEDKQGKAKTASFILPAKIANKKPSKMYKPTNPNKVNKVFPEETFGEAPSAVCIKL